jgi:hypothetical protein
VWVNGWPPGPEPGRRRFDSCRPDSDVGLASRALTNGRQPVPKTGVVVMSPRGSIPPLSSDFFLTALSANGRRSGSHPGNGGFNSPQRHARPLRLHGKASRLSIGRRGFESRAVATPTATGSRPALRTQALEVRVLSWVRVWRRAGVVTGRFATPWPTTVARVRFAPSPLRSFAPLDRNR